MYTVDYFIKKFEAIPEQKIISFNQRDGFGNHCAIGHCKNLRGEYGNCSPTRHESSDFSPEANALYLLFLNAGIKAVSMGEDSSWNIADVNNGDHPQYQQPTPKARILAALHDIKAMQEKEQKPERIKTVYVSVPETVKEQSEELIMN